MLIYVVVLVLEHLNIYITETHKKVMFYQRSCVCFSVYHVVNFTADIGNETWLTADDDIQENAEDEVQDAPAAVEPALENDIAITADGEDLEGNIDNDVAVTSTATVEISADEKLEQRKPEEELFVLIDDDLDSDIVSSHAAAFHRVDPQLDPPSAPVEAAPAQLSSPSKTSAAEGSAEVQSTDNNTGVVGTQNDASNEETAAAAAAKTTTTTTSEKASAKRLVFGC